MKEIYEIIQLKKRFDSAQRDAKSTLYQVETFIYIILINFSVFPPTRLFFPEHLFVFSAHYLQPAVELQP